MGGASIADVKVHLEERRRRGRRNLAGHDLNVVLGGVLCCKQQETLKAYSEGGLRSARGSRRRRIRGLSFKHRRSVIAAGRSSRNGDDRLNAPRTVRLNYEL